MDEEHLVTVGKTTGDGGGQRIQRQVHRSRNRVPLELRRAAYVEDNGAVGDHSAGFGGAELGESLESERGDHQDHNGERQNPIRIHKACGGDEVSSRERNASGPLRNGC